jgi:hypothetical protein
MTIMTITMIPMIPGIHSLPLTTAAIMIFLPSATIY